MADNSGSSAWVREDSFPSIRGRGGDFIEAVLAAMTDQGWSSKDVFAVNMALEESFSNAIEHGNHFDPRKQFFVKCRVEKDLVRISVRDEGKGFQLARVPNPRDEENLDMPSGRGVLLIHGFMTNVWYNDTGNEIYMEKRPSAE